MIIFLNPRPTGQIEGLVGGHGAMAILGPQRMGSGMRAVGRANKSCLLPTSSVLRVLCKRQPAQSLQAYLELPSMLVIWVVGGPQNRVQRRPPQRRSFCVRLCSGRQSRSLPLSLGLLRKLLARHGLARAGFLPLVSPITRTPQLCWLGSQTSEVAGTSYSATRLVCSPEDP